MIAPFDAFFLLLALACAIAAIHTRSLLAAVVVFGAFSFFSAMYFASLGALDVAFTEAAVGAAITTVLFVTVIFRTGPDEAAATRPTPWPARAAAVVATAVVALALLAATPDLPKVGDPNSPAASHVSPRYIESGPRETGAANMVTAVLADYRAYDTLGETVVIFTAGLACLLILGARGRADAEGGA